MSTENGHASVWLASLAVPQYRLNSRQLLPPTVHFTEPIGFILSQRDLSKAPSISSKALVTGEQYFRMTLLQIQQRLPGTTLTEKMEASGTAMYSGGFSLETPCYVNAWWLVCGFAFATPLVCFRNPIPAISNSRVCKKFARLSSSNHCISPKTTPGTIPVAGAR